MREYRRVPLSYRVRRQEADRKEHGQVRMPRGQRVSPWGSWGGGGLHGAGEGELCGEIRGVHSPHCCCLSGPWA